MASRLSPEFLEAGFFDAEFCSDGIPMLIGVSNLTFPARASPPLHTGKGGLSCSRMVVSTPKSGAELGSDFSKSSQEGAQRVR